MVVKAEVHENVNLSDAETSDEENALRADAIAQLGQLHDSMVRENRAIRDHFRLELSSIKDLVQGALNSLPSAFGSGSASGSTNPVTYSGVAAAAAAAAASRKEKDLEMKSFLP